ncbi:hypothetical protein N9L35_02395 [Alphaproteobacteria bacterium]|nr:hypothetical protein [Alphaproteobacteria bacterium]
MPDNETYERLAKSIGHIFLNHQKIRGMVDKSNQRIATQIIAPWQFDDDKFNSWLKKRNSPKFEIDNSEKFKEIFHQSLSDRYLRLVEARAYTPYSSDSLIIGEFIDNLSVIFNVIKSFGHPFDDLDSFNANEFPLLLENQVRNHIAHGFIDSIKPGFVRFIRQKKINGTTRDNKFDFGKNDFKGDTTLFYANLNLPIQTFERLEKAQNDIIFSLNNCFVDDFVPFSYFLNEGRFKKHRFVESWQDFLERLNDFKGITIELECILKEFNSKVIKNKTHSILPHDLLTGDYEPDDVDISDIDFD